MRKIYYLLFIFSLFSLCALAQRAAEPWTVGGVTYNVDILDHYTLAPNTTQSALLFKHPDGADKNFKMFFTTTDLTDPRIRVKVVQSKNSNNGNNPSVTGGETISEMFKANPTCLVGVNGDFQYERPRYDSKKDKDGVHAGDPASINKTPASKVYNSAQGHSISDGEPFLMWGRRPKSGTIGEFFPSERLSSKQWILPAIGFENGITPHIGYVGHKYKVEGIKVNTSATLTAINEGRRYKDDLILYTPAFNVYNGIEYNVNGLDATGTTAVNKYGKEVKLEKISKKGDVTTFKIVDIRKGGEPFKVSDGYYVLSGHGTGSNALEILGLSSQDAIGKEVKITQQIIFDSKNTVPNITQLICGYPMLVQNGNNVAEESLTYLNETTGLPIFEWHGNKRRSRTAVGYNQDYTKFIMLVIEEKSTTSKYGVTLSEVAEIMIDLGCSYAINLDGGGTSEMYDRKQGAINIPSGSKGKKEYNDEPRERTFHNCITIESDKAADNVIAEIRFKDPSKTLKPGETYTEPVVMAYNKEGILICPDLQGKPGFSLSCLEELGTVKDKGGNLYDLIAGQNASGTHSLVAYYTTEDGTELTASMPVTVENNAVTDNCYLVQLEDDATDNVKVGNAHSRLAISGNKLFVWSGKYSDHKQDQNLYMYTWNNISGQFVALSSNPKKVFYAEAMTTDELGNVIIKDGIGRYNVYDSNGTFKSTTLVNEAYYTSAKHIGAFGNDFLGKSAYLVLPMDGKLVGAYADKGTYGVIVSDSRIAENSYINTYRNSKGEKEIWISTGNEAFIYNMNTKTINNVDVNFGKNLSSVFGGCRVLMGGKDVYLYNSGDGFTGTSSNKNAGAFISERYNFNQHLSGLTAGVNYLLPLKIDNNNYIIFQYSTSENILRAYKLRGDNCENMFPALTGQVSTEVVTGVQSKKFKILNDSVKTEYLVIKQLDATIKLDRPYLADGGPIRVSSKNVSILGNGCDASKIIEGDSYTFTDLKPQDLQRQSVIVKTPATGSYSLSADVRYRWYDGTKDYPRSLTFNNVKPDYEVKPITDLNGEVIFLKSHPYPGQPQNMVPNNAIVIIDFKMDRANLAVAPVSEYRVYRKEKSTGKSELISTVRGDKSEGQLGGQGAYADRKFMGTYVEEVKDAEDAKRLANDYVYYVETVYADVNSPSEDKGLNAQKIVRSEELQLIVKEGGIPTEVEEIIVNNGVKVYPTLVDNIINIESEDGVNQVGIYSLAGSFVKGLEFGGEAFVSLDMDDLASGTYIVRINDKDFVKVMKK